MNAVTVLPNALTTQTNAIRTALKTSLYPGASDESVDMVLAYCQAGQFDPMTKPVHIVPMRDSQTQKYRDVIMPGIGLYRIQAARTGQYAGVSEPQYGPDTTVNLDGTEITFPAWCKIVVKRILSDGTVAEFAATERWIENYANAGYDKDRGGVSSAPNSMWKKRPYGQLAKCAEAQALRKAFPEIGAQPTFEEMEGKSLDADNAPVMTAVVNTAVALPVLPDCPTDKFNENLPKFQQQIESGQKTPEQIITMLSSKYSVSEEQRNTLFGFSRVEKEEKKS